MIMRFPRKYLHSPFVRRRPAPFSFPGTPGTPPRTAPVENRPQRLCTVAQLALDARKDLGIPVGSMPVQL